MEEVSIIETSSIFNTPHTTMNKIKLKLFHGCIRIASKTVHVISVAGWLHEKMGFEPMIMRGELNSDKAFRESFSNYRKSLKMEKCILEPSKMPDSDKTAPVILMLAKYVKVPESPRVFAKLPESWTEGDKVDDIELPLNWLPPLVLSKSTAVKSLQDLDACQLDWYGTLNKFLTGSDDIVWLKSENSVKISWKEYKDWDKNGSHESVSDFFNDIAADVDYKEPWEIRPRPPKVRENGKVDIDDYRRYLNEVNDLRLKRFHHVPKDKEIDFIPWKKKHKVHQ